MRRKQDDPGHAISACARLRLDGVKRDDGDDGVPVLRLEGEFDFDSVTGVDRFLRRRLGPFYQRRHLVMDLHDVTLMDSGFVGFLVRLGGEQRRGHSELVLARPVGRIRAVVCMVGLPNLVPVYETLDEALQALRDARAPLIPPAFSVAR